MIAILEAIVNGIETALNFIVSIFSGLIEMVKYVEFSSSSLTTISAYLLPSQLLGIVLAFIAVSVVLLIVGR